MGIDAISLPVDRAYNLFLYRAREHADEKQRAAIDKALEPPVTYKVNGRPAWYGDDEDAWQEFAVQLRK